MNLDKYQLKADETISIFQFTSLGPKGQVQKIIHFQPTNTANLFNLAFGDKPFITGDIDDLSVTNNRDTDKVLATVAFALYIFTDNYPDVFVYATGSTPARTRLYRMGITRFYNDVIKDFFLFGLSKNEFQEFQIGEEYEGFLGTRKFL